jgi:hypothetical protein
MDAKLNTLPPSQRQQYFALVQEQAALTQEGKRFEGTTLHVQVLVRWMCFPCIGRACV